MARQEKVVLTNMCMVYDGEGNILVQDRLNPDWPGLLFLEDTWNLESPSWSP